MSKKKQTEAEKKIPIHGARQPDVGGMGDAKSYIEGKQRIMSNIGTNYSGSGGAYGVDFVNSMWYSPELMPDVWVLPKSRMEILKWVRFFYNTDPYIYAIINMHSLFPFSMFDIVSSDEKVSEFYYKASFNKDFNLYDFVLDMSLAYNKFGEAICMGQPEEINYEGIDIFKFKNFILFEPEVVNIYKSALERKEHYSLVITPEFKEEIRQLRDKGKEVHPLLREALDTNSTEIDLDGTYMSKVINKTDPSAVRGTSPIQPLLRTLMFQDKVNMLKITAIDRYRYPLEIWKIGDVSQNILPDPAVLSNFEKMIKTAKENPPYSLFVPPFVEFSTAGMGSEQSLFNYEGDYEWVRDSIMVGLGVNKNLIQGDGPSFSNVKQLALQKLFMGYMAVRDRFTNWMVNHYFYPIAEENDFVSETGDLNIPEVVWYKNLDLDRDTADDYQKLWDKGLISTKTLFGKYTDLDYGQEQELLKDEINSIYDDQKRIRNREPKPIDGEEPVGGEGAEAGGGIPEEFTEEIIEEPGGGGAPSGEGIEIEETPPEEGGGEEGGGEALPPEE